MIDQVEIDLKQDLILKHDQSSYLFKKFMIAKDTLDKCKELTKNKIPVEADVEDNLELT